MRAFEPLHERLDCRTVTKDDHVIRQILIGDARDALLESLGQKWQKIDRNDQEDEKDADELHQDDQEHHRRMRPVRVVAVAGGAETLGRPFQRLEKCAVLAF